MPHDEKCPICGMTGQHKMSCRPAYRECVDRYEGHITCEGRVTYEPDPFMEEIWGDDTPVWMCEGHRHESAMDI